MKMTQQEYETKLTTKFLEYKTPKYFVIAEPYKKQIEYTARYKNYIEEHSEPIDWGNKNQLKYSTYYDLDGKEIRFEDTYSFINQGSIYASSEQIIKDAINEIGEDNFKKYVLRIK